MSEIKNIIFDLGGVIINLDINKSIQEFNKLSKKPFESIYTQLQQSLIFDQFDKGEITETVFFHEIQRALETSISEENLLLAWNAMLLDFPLNRLKLLEKLKPNYRLFLLSNTNETHVTAFESTLYKEHGYLNLNNFFETVYYSCRIGMRKPNEDIFNFVLNTHNLIAEETLFIDDSPQHVEGALSIGIKAKLLAKNREVEDLIKELGLI